MDQDTTLDVPLPAPHTTSDAAPTTTLVADELLIEEISIDGMCGVY